MMKIPAMAAGTGELLHRSDTGPARDELLPLLLLADDSELQVRSYYQQGDLFVLCRNDGIVMGITLAIHDPGGGVELKAVAVAPALQGRGVGQRMMKLVLAELRATGVRHVTVGTSSSGIGQLAFYQKTGFRLWKIERDFFSPERGYQEGTKENGILLRDLVWMDQAL
jgi:ribosomal protein S18 acetylase RimI-like enzyme